MSEKFGPKVRRLRLNRRWSQQELALRSGISTPHISSIERGMRHPSLEYAMRMAEALGVQIGLLCDDSETVLPTTKMKGSPYEWPMYLQNFILNEASEPFLVAAHKMSTLPPSDGHYLTMLIELVAQQRRNSNTL